MKIKFNIIKKKTPDEMYEEYIVHHRQGVKDAFNNIIKPVLLKENIDDTMLSKIEDLIEKHDESKFGIEEWAPYRDHFYDPKNNPKSNNIKYDYAWNHHQKTNPHHWQFWCLINDVDDPQVQALDMPFEYIIEMLCDWHSAGKHYGNTAYDWWVKQQERFIMTDNTKNIINKYINLFK